MKRTIVLIGLAALALGVLPLSIASAETSATPACTATGFYRDGINMTAALIDPTTPVAGKVDATGCNIGVYFDKGTGSVDGAEISGANYFGVLVNGDVSAVSVDVKNSKVHDIGESPLNGTQHGVAIYYRAFGAGAATGNISGNTIWNYQKGGIVANGAGTKADIRDNTVTGQGPVNYIAQNGIQVGYGASATVMQNSVTGNSYTGPNYASSGGILVVGGAGYGSCPDGNPCPYTTGTVIQGNSVAGNDVGVWLSNLDANYNPPKSQTNIKVVNNVISNGSLNNKTGNGTTPYQAGISDVGNNDKLIDNKISGAGYDPTTKQGSTFDIDASPSFTNRAKIHADSFSD